MDYYKQTSGAINEELRKEAMEKELLRLKTINQKQSKKLHRLRKVLFFFLLFFIVLFVMLLINGMIKWPEDKISIKKEEKTKQTPDTEITQKQESAPPIVIPTQVEDGLIFKIPADGILYSVQIGAYASIEMAPFQMNLLSLRQYSYEGINQYSAGLFHNHEQAQSFLSVIKQMGFTDAFIISTHFGKRISISEALAIQSKALKNNASEATGEFLNDAVVEEKFAGYNP